MFERSAREEQDTYPAVAGDAVAAAPDPRTVSASLALGGNGGADRALDFYICCCYLGDRLEAACNRCERPSRADPPVLPSTYV